MPGAESVAGHQKSSVSKFNGLVHDLLLIFGFAICRSNDIMDSQS
jgi:hypothetical protein